MDTIKQAARSAKDALSHSKSSNNKQELILITGGTGFVAAHVLNSFLSRGYHVRTTVRSQEKASQVQVSHKRYASQLSFAIIKDMTAAGAFDEAVKGVDGVIHTASPVTFAAKDPENDVLIPAIKGTTRVLESVVAHAPQVKRVVITSSIAAMLDKSRGPWPEHTYTEADWNPVTWEEAKTGDGMTTYAASKTFAERAAFDFVEEHKPSFTIANVCPPMIYGPLAHYANIDSINSSTGMIWRYLNGSMKDEAGPGATAVYAYVDVRDVAEAHYKAYVHEAKTHERYFVAGGSFLMNDVCAILKEEYRGTELEANVPNPEGTPRIETFKVDNSKSRRELGLEYISLEKCVKDAAKSLLQLKEAAKTGKRVEYREEDWA